MEDVEKNLEEHNDSNVSENSEEKSTGESSEQLESSEKPVDEEPELTEEAFLDGYELPGKPKTLEEALTAYKQLVTAKSQETPPGKQPEKQHEPSAKGEFPDNPFSQTVDQMVNGGRIKAEEAQQFRGLAQAVDSAYSPVLKTMFQKLKQAESLMSLFVGHIREQSWVGFPHKQYVDRGRLDRIMDESGLLNYTDAYRKLAIESGDPNLIRHLVPDNGRKGQFKFTGMGRGKDRQEHKEPVYKGYITPDGELDRGKLNRLSQTDPNKATEISEAYIADLTKKVSTG